MSVKMILRFHSKVVKRNERHRFHVLDKDISCAPVIDKTKRCWAMIKNAYALFHYKLATSVAGNNDIFG